MKGEMFEPMFMVNQHEVMLKLVMDTTETDMTVFQTSEKKDNQEVMLLGKHMTLSKQTSRDKDKNLLCRVQAFRDSIYVFFLLFIFPTQW